MMTRRVCLTTALAILGTALVFTQPAVIAGQVERAHPRRVTTAYGDDIIETTLELRGGRTVVVPGGQLGDVTLKVSGRDLFTPGDWGTFVVEHGRASVAMKMGSEPYLARPYRWPGSTVSYYINASNLDMPGSSAVQSITAAAQNWFTQATISLQMVYAGSMTGGTLSKNGRNEVFFRNVDSGSVIAEVYWWYNSRNEFIDADMVFYDTKRFFPGSSGCSSGYYLTDIATHEFGHWYGLGHSSVSGATMWPSASKCSTNTRSLAADDIAGVESMYGLSDPTEPDPDPTPTAIVLTVKPEPRVLLRWSWAAGTYVDVFLNGARIATTANDGAHRFNVATGLGSYQFAICEAGTSRCSATVTVTF
jgi:hypothetical protein